MPVAIQFYIQSQVFLWSDQALVSRYKKKKFAYEGNKLKQFPLCKAPGSDNKRSHRCWRENRLMHKARKLRSFSASNLSVHVMPTKAASLGATKPGQVFAHCLAPALSSSVKLQHSHLQGRSPFPNRISTWVPPCMCSADTAAPQFGPWRWKRLLSLQD